MSKVNRYVKYWLLLGVIMVFFQVVIGGITRLTGSGLSITKWDIVLGVIPPLNEMEWNHAFDLYKQTPQYAKINAGMSLADFKFIYFWEFFHRLWARSLGFVFFIPYLVFRQKNWLPVWLIKRLGILVLLGALVGAFGWIMVKSGLSDRPWVSAYKLSLHLSLALLVFCHLLWTYFRYTEPQSTYSFSSSMSKWSKGLFVFVCIQIFLGGLMSGMKAGLIFPTFPDMKGEYLPSVLFDTSYWNVQTFIDYDKSVFVPALVQFFHRSIAYVIVAVSLWIFFKYKTVLQSTESHTLMLQLLGILTLQVTLGIITVLSCVGTIPVMWGVLHQAVALLLLTLALKLVYKQRKMDIVHSISN